MIFGQEKPDPNIPMNLYTADAGVFGTLYIAATVGYDIVSVQIIPATIAGNPVVVSPTDPGTYILKSCELIGNTPIYLQQIYLGIGDTLRITSGYGDCAFTFTGDYV